MVNMSPYACPVWDKECAMQFISDKNYAAGSLKNYRNSPFRCRMSEETPERRSMFRSLYNGGQKNNTQKTKKPKRPKSSSIEFDRLLRFKSDIQLNITKKVS